MLEHSKVISRLLTKSKNLEIIFVDYLFSIDEIHVLRETLPSDQDPIFKLLVFKSILLDIEVGHYYESTTIMNLLLKVACNIPCAWHSWSKGVMSKDFVITKD